MNDPLPVVSELFPINARSKCGVITVILRFDLEGKEGF